MGDLTTEILKEIRDELRSTRTELSQRIDVTNERLERLERRQTEGEIRLATEITAVVGAVNALRDLLVEDRALRATVAEHETRIVSIERRLGGPPGPGPRGRPARRKAGA